MTGRKALFLITAGMAILLALLFRIFGAGSIWHAWAVPTIPPGFADLRDVLRGIDLAKAGNSSDPFGLVGGYPRIWSALGWLGIGEGGLFWAAAAVFILYWISLFLFARNYRPLTAVLMSIIIFSPAAMLGYERGNLDLAIFALLSIALFLSQYSYIPGLGLILLTAMLKVYPIVGLAYFLRETRKKFLLWAGIGLGVFILYAVSLGRSLKGIVEYIPKGSLFDYGAGVIGFRVYEVGFARLQANLVMLLSFVVLYLIFVAVVYLSYRYPDEPTPSERPFLDAFRLGAAIYIGTFVQGNSFNYRLIFLLFCIPQLVVWAEASGHMRAWARVGLVSALASCWGAMLLHVLPADPALALDEIFNWVLFIVLCYFFIVSLPEWIRGEIDKFFKKYDRRRIPTA